LRGSRKKKRGGSLWIKKRKEQEEDFGVKTRKGPKGETNRGRNGQKKFFGPLQKRGRTGGGEKRGRAMTVKNSGKENESLGKGGRESFS